ncbi:hypothetical protein [Streptomyces hawaiiensis]|uniref:hypothetical protein n=1 Tax=Streptomyces hawaiiensis TaxID=67305 RepID=UPI00364C47DC
MRTCARTTSARGRPAARSRSSHTYESHVAWTCAWLDQLELADMTLFEQEQSESPA